MSEALMLQGMISDGADVNVSSYSYKDTPKMHDIALSARFKGRNGGRAWRDRLRQFGWRVEPSMAPEELWIRIEDAVLLKDKIDFGNEEHIHEKAPLDEVDSRFYEISNTKELRAALDAIEAQTGEKVPLRAQRESIREMRRGKRILVAIGSYAGWTPSEMRNASIESVDPGEPNTNEPFWSNYKR